MSILKTIKALNKPLDELAMLPQEMIIQMAQREQIPMVYVAPILNEKAELAKTKANAAALAKAKQTQGSVVEQLIAQNAAAEAQGMEDMGIGALPVRDDMYADEGGAQEYAGGGIVAFAGGDPVYSINQPSGVDKERLKAWYRAQGLPLPEELRSGSDAPAAAPRSMAETDPLLREFNALPKPQGPGPASDMSELFGNAFRSISSVGDQTRVDPRTGKVISFGDFRRMREQAGQTGAVPSKDEMRAAAERTKASMTPGGRMELERGQADSGMSYEDLMKFMNTAKGEGAGEAKAGEGKKEAGVGKTADVAKKAAAAGKTIPEYLNDLRSAYREAGYDFESIKEAEEDRIAKQESEISDQKKEDAWMATLRAGLGMMGGESPYALANIGKGAEAGIEAYGKSTKERRAAQKELDKAKTDLVKAEQLDRKGMAEEAFKIRDKALSQIVEQQKADAATLAAEAQMLQAKNPRDTSLRAALVDKGTDLTLAEAALIKGRLDAIRGNTDLKYAALLKEDKKNNTNKAGEYLKGLEDQYMSILARGRATLNANRPGGMAGANVQLSQADQALLDRYK